MKYLKVHENELNPNQKFNINMPIEKMYISYLNNQIEYDRGLKQREKTEGNDISIIDKYMSRNT